MVRFEKGDLPEDGSAEPTDDAVVELRIKDVAELVRAAHKELLVDLLAKLQAGVASHQEKAILRNLLRDNGMVIAPRSFGQTEEDRQRPVANLPEFAPPEYEE